MRNTPEDDAVTRSEDHHSGLPEQQASQASDPDGLSELDRRARRALADPQGAEPWEIVERRLTARLANR